MNRNRGDRISAVIQEKAMRDHDKIHVAIKPTTLGSYQLTDLQVLIHFKMVHRCEHKQNKECIYKVTIWCMVF